MPEFGETHLEILLKNLSPKAQGLWAFVVIKSQTDLGSAVPLMTFAEKEGVTAIVPFEDASGLDIRFIATRIDLTVHSSLSAVGLTAAVTSALANHGIPANVVAAVHHDYLFVPPDRAHEALSVLNNLSADPEGLKKRYPTTEAPAPQASAPKESSIPRPRRRGPIPDPAGGAYPPPRSCPN